MPLRGVERKIEKNRQKYIKNFFHVFICFYLFFFIFLFNAAKRQIIPSYFFIVSNRKKINCTLYAPAGRGKKK